MREIKFRAWCVYKKEMTHDMNKIYESYIDNNGRFKWMQFTGLKDKNGKDIYEGDIVKYIHKVGDHYWGNETVTDILEVTWDIRHAKYSISNLSTHDVKDMLMKDLEVIGNIYEKGDRK